MIQTCMSIDPPPADKSSKAQVLPPCAACKNLVSSFSKVLNILNELFHRKMPQLCLLLQGMERTVRGKFEGGDADWEESRLGNYGTSEVRLIEIQEKLCSDIARGQDQVIFKPQRHHLD